MMASSWPSPSTAPSGRSPASSAIHAGNGICYRFDALANGFGLFRGMAVTAEVHDRNFNQFISPVSEPTVPGALIVKTAAKNPEVVRNPADASYSAASGSFNPR